VAVDGAEIVGFATISSDELAALYVDPDRWRRGVGRTLIAGRARRAGVARRRPGGAVATRRQRARRAVL
jgi:GNAT superfamily N-acetyltransferase